MGKVEYFWGTLGALAAASEVASTHTPDVRPHFVI